MHVYVIEEQIDGKPTGFVKIGKANTPNRRLSGLRTGNPRKLVVRFAFRCGEFARAIEDAAHESLIAVAAGGEWFKISSENARSFVAAVVREHNQLMRSCGLLTEAEVCREIPLDQAPIPVSSDESLRKLPVVFDLKEVQEKLGIDRAYARKVTKRWAENSAIEQIGPKAGLYYNLVFDPKASGNYIKDVLDKLIARPYIGLGPSSFRLHEWSNKIVRIDDIAVMVVPGDDPLPQVRGVSLVPRPESWFDLIGPKCLIGYGGFPVAPPEYALVEAIKADDLDGLWKPQPDDLDFTFLANTDDLSRRIEQAAVALKADIDQVREFVSRIDGFCPTSPSP